jgi:hypothetical protein
MPASRFDITAQELAALSKLNPAAAMETKALANISQVLYDVLGNYPLDNVLPYVYGIQNRGAGINPTVPANATVANQFKVTADAGFIAMSVRGQSSGDFLVQARIDSSDRILMNIPVASSSFVGTGQRPAPLHKPLVLPANTTVSFDLTDISGSPNDIFLYFVGFKVYQVRQG